MIGAIAIVLIAVWFYKSAERLELPSLQWVAGGVIVYYGGFSAWMYGLLRPLLGGHFQNHGLWLGLGMDISSVLAGVLMAALFRSMILLKRGRRQYERNF